MDYEAILQSYEVEWTTPSGDSSGSMPVGGCDVGLNVWVEGGDVLFYFSRSGTIDENGQMLKLGRCRLRLTPSPFRPGGAFRQTLKLRQGEIVIAAGEEGNETLLSIWVEPDRPVIHAEVRSESPIMLEACYESWRFEPRQVTDRDPCSTLIGYPGDVYTLPDSVFWEENGIVFYHRNDPAELKFDQEVALQQLEAYRSVIHHPTKDLTFGGVLTGDGMSPYRQVHDAYAGIPYRGWALRSETPERSHHVAIRLHTAQTPNPQEWRRQLQRSMEGDRDLEAAREARLQWWAEFWRRSYIAIRPQRPDPNDPVWQVGRNYQLFRFMLACNAYGAEPTKFNGGLFTFDPVYVRENYRGETPDFRRWGGSTFTAQNQRLVYWPMLKSGDFDMMAPQFEFYRKALDTAELRSRVYWGHEGCAFAEQLNHTGLPTGREYGWSRSPDVEPGVEDNAYVNYEYVHQLDFAFMIIQHYRYSGREIGPYMRFVDSAVRFFDRHYRYRHKSETGRELDENGHLVIAPSTALETFKNATNPADVIAGLTAVLQELLQLPEALADSAAKREWLDMLRRVPPLPYEEKEGKRTIAPAASWTHVQNVELPQLYPVFPFRMYGIGRPDLNTAIHTWQHSVYHSQHRNHVSWHQGNIFTAMLGLTEEAAEFAVKKLADGPHRFPAFWGPGHDWTPDHNWGGSGMIGLQEMLMQTCGRTIYLLPAWPDGWDVDFKLHAPYQTVVEGSYRNGRLQIRSVQPESRRSDIVVMRRTRA
ncbi:DUF5703 domain-containing protein [Paenibacillus sp.]|uniref:DUF5703 domain-containing protein n=1 Tax=Paenibacillus sp. TaxID=58172 RepID=UPI002D3F2857|nr:DUF5703 domain-containing protein [Paenibacillus sp.]HZG87926.1 DUF5703 domain-containing protein [Paenibacillus sp.]